MKYLILLLLVSCASTPNCTVKESGVILNRTFTILECNRPIEKYTDDTSVFDRYCLPEKENDKFVCFVRN